jgi:arylsulfatase A-like enzyme
VLTGEYPHTHGMKMNMDCHTLAAQRVRCRQDTLAHRLKKQGYRCGYNGKWHLGDRALHITDDVTLPSHLPSDVGFEGYDHPGHGDGGQIFDDYQKYLRDNTVIIFTADHGETLGSHAGLGDKGWHHFEEIQRIPFIAWLPKAYYKGGVQPGDRFEQLVSLADVFPSILDLAGEKREQIGAQGESFMKLVENEDSLWRDCVVTQFWGLGNIPTNMLSIRYKGYKYGWNGTGGNELYDLANDPYELKNVIDLPEFHDIKQMMIDKLLDWMDENDMRPGFKRHFLMTSRS